MIVMYPTIQIIGSERNVSDVIEFAASELGAYLSRVFPSGTDRIFQLKLVKDGFVHDGYQISCHSNFVVISASLERGILHGVYELLRNLGCHFLFPGKHREYIPILKEWPLAEDFLLRREPWLEYRGICLYNTTKATLSKTKDAVDWMAKNGFNFLLTSIHRLDDTTCGDHAILWDEIGEELLPHLQKRGIVIDMSEHSTDYFFPKRKLFLKHPQWFAKINGVRMPGQICYSNQEAVEALADSFARFAEDKPWFKFLGTWPLDGGGYCQCEKCKDPQTIFRSNCVIAEKVKKVRPDLIVEHLAYTPQSFPRPATKMPENMSVLVCHVRDEVASQWGTASKNAGGAFYFDYQTADHYRYRSNVMLNPRFTRDTINAMVGYGYRGTVSLYLPIDCWFQSSINLRWLSLLSYNPSLSLEELYQILSGELFGQEGQALGAELLREICENLLEPNLWNSKAMTHDWYAEHIINRNRDLDSLHSRKFDDAYRKIQEILSQLSQVTGDDFRKNVRWMEEWAELQSLYYHCIDQYDGELDNEQRAEPYLQKLKELNQEEDSPFITEKYARWRILGRDNIFRVAKDNLFQAQT